MTTNYNYRPTQTKEKEIDAEVIVIGAGVAGLSCASELQKAGVDVVVYEASHHIGGRIRTLRESEFKVQLPKSHTRWLRYHYPKNGTNSSRQLGTDNFGFEVGAEFVHGSETFLNQVIRENNIKLKELFTWAHGDGGPSEEHAPDGGFGMYWIGKEKKLIMFNEQDDELKHMVSSLWRIGDKSIQATEDDTRTLYEYLKDEGVSERVIGMAEAGYANTVAGTLAKIGYSNMARCERNWYYDGDGDYRVEGTMEEQILRSLANSLNIQFNSPVVEIQKLENNIVNLKVLGGEMKKCKAVVITSSISCLQRGIIKFQPPLPSEYQNAIQSIECEPGLKLCVKFTKQFWPEKLHGMVCSDSFAPEIWFDCYEPPSNSAHKTKVFYATAFYTSDQARNITKRLNNEGDDTVFNALLDQFDEMFQVNSRNYYAGGLVCDWGAVPYIWGAYATPSLKEDPNARETLSLPIEDKIFFAGEATDPFNFMTAHAAASTGVRAARGAITTVLKHRLDNVTKLSSKL